MSVIGLHRDPSHGGMLMESSACNDRSAKCLRCVHDNAKDCKEENCLRIHHEGEVSESSAALSRL